MAVKELKRLSLGDKWRQLREAEGLRRTDLRMLKLAAKEEGIKEGLAQGLDKGREEEKRETARRLKAMGMSSEQIRTALGLSDEGKS
jgi:predicted transposase/invertase (TIGR01784 family)